MAEPAGIDPSELRSLPLLGHGGLLDDLRHCLTAVGSKASRVRLQDDPEQMKAIVEDMRVQLRRMDTIATMMQLLAECGGLDIPEAREEDRAWLAQREFSDAELEVIKRHLKVRPQ